MQSSAGNASTMDEIKFRERVIEIDIDKELENYEGEKTQYVKLGMLLMMKNILKIVTTHDRKKIICPDCGATLK